MFFGEGVVEYRGNTCSLIIDPEIVRYYRKLIPKYIECKPPKFTPHITVVREWEKTGWNFLDHPYAGYIFDFVYDPYIHYESPYFYLKCWCREIGMIREEFGLVPYRKDGCYHITIGNSK